MKRKEYKSNAPWENLIGYNRAVKIGKTVEVAGTTSINEKGITIGKDYYDQTCFILKKIEKALNHFGLTKEDIIKTRIYVLDIQEWKSVAKSHSEFFNNNRPVNTTVEVSKFIKDELLIEIEATAIKSK